MYEVFLPSPVSPRKRQLLQCFDFYPVVASGAPKTCCLAGNQTFTNINKNYLGGWCHFHSWFGNDSSWFGNYLSSCLSFITVKKWHQYFHNIAVIHGGILQPVVADMKSVHGVSRHQVPDTRDFYASPELKHDFDTNGWVHRLMRVHHCGYIIRKPLKATSWSVDCSAVRRLPRFVSASRATRTSRSTPLVDGTAWEGWVGCVCGITLETTCWELWQGTDLHLGSSAASDWASRALTSGVRRLPERCRRYSEETSYIITTLRYRSDDPLQVRCRHWTIPTCQFFQLMMKEAHTGGPFVWHQDYGYWYNNGCMLPEMGSIFMPIDKYARLTGLKQSRHCISVSRRCSRQNGCLQVLRGSHQLGRIDHQLTGEQVMAVTAWLWFPSCHAHCLNFRLVPIQSVWRQPRRCSASSTSRWSLETFSSSTAIYCTPGSQC